MTSLGGTTIPTPSSDAYPCPRARIELGKKQRRLGNVPLCVLGTPRVREVSGGRNASASGAAGGASSTLAESGWMELGSGLKRGERKGRTRASFEGICGRLRE